MTTSSSHFGFTIRPLVSPSIFVALVVSLSFSSPLSRDREIIVILFVTGLVFLVWVEKPTFSTQLQRQALQNECCDGSGASMDQQNLSSSSGQLFLSRLWQRWFNDTRSVSSFSLGGRCIPKNHNHNQNDHLQQEVPQAAEDEEEEEEPQLDQTTVAASVTSTFDDGEQQQEEDEHPTEQQENKKNRKQETKQERAPLSNFDDSSTCGDCSFLSAGKEEDEDPNTSDCTNNKKKYNCATITGATATTATATISRRSPSAPLSLGCDAAASSVSSSSSSSSSHRSIFSDYWKSQGNEHGTCCPAGLWTGGKTDPVHSKLFMATAASLSSSASSLSSSSSSSLNDDEDDKPVPRLSLSSSSSSSSSFHPPETTVTSISCHGQLRRSIFGGATAPSCGGAVPFSPMFVWQQQQQPNQVQQVSVALAAETTKRIVQQTVSSPSLSVLSASSSYSSSSSSTTALCLHPYYDLGESATTARSLRKTKSHSALPLPRRPSALRRTGRYSTIGGIASTNKTATPATAGTTKLTRSPSVTFKEEVDVAMLPAAWSVWTVNYAAEGWSNWFA